MTVYESPRETPVHAQTDVLVVGGGPAGCAAALAARRLGAEVTLVERYNHLGGLSTGGLVIWIDRMTDWTGQLVIDGFAREILEQLPDHAVAGAPEAQWGSQDEGAVAHWGGRQGAFRGVVTWSPMIDPEWLKLASVELLAAGGRAVPAPQLGGGRGARRRQRERGHLREQAGPPGTAGAGGDRRHRRPRRVPAGRRRRSSQTPTAARATSSTASTPGGPGRASTSRAGWPSSARTPRGTAR